MCLLIFLADYYITPTNLIYDNNGVDIGKRKIHIEGRNGVGGDSARLASKFWEASPHRCLKTGPPFNLFNYKFQLEK